MGVFTPEEVRLAKNIEKTIFIINRRVPIGNEQVGVTLEVLIEELNRDREKDLQYTEDLMASVIQKCKENHILAEVDGKLYSITYYGE